MTLPVVGVVLKGYPRLSETFIAQELRGLERQGLTLRLFSLRHPTDAKTHPVHAEIEGAVSYLPEYLHDEPARVRRAWIRARRLPGYAEARRLFLADLRRDPSRNRLRRWGQALVLAAEAPAEIGAFYAHFIHTPGSVARYAAAIRRLNWAVSAHAKDIWTTPDWDLAGKLGAAAGGGAAWATACTADGRKRLAALAADPAKVRLNYHGLDPARFPPFERPDDTRRPDGVRGPARLLSVGRLVPKKGYDTLLAALARLPAPLDWRFVHIGGGPEKAALHEQASELGLGARIDWRGPADQGEVLAAYRSADLFVLASRIAGDGDRDGLPNVLMEAQSQGLACVSTRVAGVPELILDGETGLLVPPEDPAALARALADLLGDPALRRRLGAAGAERVGRDFDAAGTIAALAADLARLTGLPAAPQDGRGENSLPNGTGTRCASPSTRR